MISENCPFWLLCMMLWVWTTNLYYIIIGIIYIKIVDGPMIFNINAPQKRTRNINHRNLILCDLFEMVESWPFQWLRHDITVFKLRNPKLNPRLPRLHPGARGVDLRHRGFMLHVLVISSLAHVFPQLSGSRTCGPWQQIRGPLQWGTFPTGFPAGFGCVGYISERRGKRRFNYYFSSIKGLFEKKTGCFLLVSCFFHPYLFCLVHFFRFHGGGAGEPGHAPPSTPPPPRVRRRVGGILQVGGISHEKQKMGKWGYQLDDESKSLRMKNWLEITQNPSMRKLVGFRGSR